MDWPSAQLHLARRVKAMTALPGRGMATVKTQLEIATHLEVARATLDADPGIASVSGCSPESVPANRRLSQRSFNAPAQRIGCLIQHEIEELGIEEMVLSGLLTEWLLLGRR
jgi:hypothetical protein